MNQASRFVHDKEMEETHGIIDNRGQEQVLNNALASYG
jgi:hypothetical protein